MRLKSTRSERVASRSPGAVQSNVPSSSTSIVRTGELAVPTSIARLEMAAQRLQHAGEIAGVESSQSIVQLQEAVETLVGLEPQLAKPSTDWADLGPLLHQAVALVAPLASPGGVQLDTPASGQVLVQGPAGDLLDTFRCLLDQALVCRDDPIFVTLRAHRA